MAAPTPVNRGIPAGIRLDDPHPTLLTLASADATLALWEKSLKPPGKDNQSPIQTGTMHNVSLMTMAPNDLSTLTEATFKFAYDPSQLDEIYARVGVRDSMTFIWSTLDFMCFWGYLKSISPDEITDGQQPTMTATVQPTNTDPNTGEEEGPIFGTF
jgi:hypothetical protein